MEIPKKRSAIIRHSLLVDRLTQHIFSLIVVRQVLKNYIGPNIAPWRNVTLLSLTFELFTNDKGNSRTSKKCRCPIEPQITKATREESWCQ
jgi:hypothetical protein